MPKDQKRNIQNYQIQGGDLNEFEFQKSQSELAEDSELPFAENINKPGPTEALDRIAQVTTEAHLKVEKRKRRGLAQLGSRKSNASSKKPAKKAARKSVRKETTLASTKQRSNAGSRRSAQKVTKKAIKKGARSAGSKSGRKTAGPE